MTETASPPADPHAATFEANFVEIFFATHTFGGERRIEDVEAVYKGETLDDDMVSAARAKLVPRELTAPLERARDRIYRLLRTYCLPGDVRGSYYVSTLRSEEFVAKFRDLVAEFDAAADGVAAAYPDILQRARDRWLPKMSGDEAEYARTIGRHLPGTAADLRACYRVEFRPLHSVTRATGYKSGAIKQWFEEAHRNYQAHEEAARRRRYAEPIERFRAAIAAFARQVAEGTKLGPKSFTGVEEALILFGTCVDIVAPELVAVVDDLARQLADVKAAADAAMRGGGTFTAEVKARRQSLEAMIAKAVDECGRATAALAHAEQFGRPPRRLGLATPAATAVPLEA